SRLTLTGTGTTLVLLGDGHVVNDATIDRADPAGSYPALAVAASLVVPNAISYSAPNMAVYRREQIPLGAPGSFFALPYGSNLASFTNNGILNGDISVATASFVNNGTVNLGSGGQGSAITTGADQDFLF